MYPENPVVQLCIEGTQAEFQKLPDKARLLYQKAWEIAQDDYEACIAAHYVARFQESNEEKFRWNKIALDKAKVVTDNRVQSFFPSLLVNMGHSFELLGNIDEAKRYYDLAAEAGISHQASNLLDNSK
jgi:hypothetical protein